MYSNAPSTIMHCNAVGYAFGIYEHNASISCCEDTSCLYLLIRMGMKNHRD